jgi:transcription antitermination factor NusG
VPNSILALEESEAALQPEWYALYTRHQHEKTAADILTRKRFQVFLPLYAAQHRWKDRTKLLSLPVFPCYLFVHSNPGRRLEILTTPGVHAIVSIANQPAAIPASEIEALQRIIESGTPMEPHPFLKCGERVRVKYGSLEGIEGILVRKRKSFRLVLSVEMLGKSAAVEVDAIQVEKTSSNRQVGRNVEHRMVSAHL